jgi:hypothetical protein
MGGFELIGLPTAATNGLLFYLMIIGDYVIMVQS